MKYLYLWNDLPLFFHDTMAIEHSVQRFVTNLTISSSSWNCLDYLLTCDQFYRWPRCIPPIDKRSAILIGRRPLLALQDYLCLPSQALSMMKIFPIKKWYPYSPQQTVHLSSSDCRQLCQFVAHKKSVAIFEDVIITGQTIDIVLNYIFKINPKIQITLHVFSINAHTDAWLRQRFKNLEINAHHMMQGQAQTESTLLSFHDLCFRKINGVYLRSMRKIMYPCFFTMFHEMVNVFANLERKLPLTQSNSYTLPL